MLGALQNNGGPTLTHLPQPGSAAIGGVPLAACSVNTDQRGFPRPGGSGSSCDIGAVETGQAPVLTPTTTALSSSSNPSTAGQSVTYTATVSPPPGAGTLSFTDGGSPIAGCGSLSLTGGGQATCSTTPSAGSHSIVADYSGTSVYAASTSPVLNQVASGPPTATRTLTVTRSGQGTVSSSPTGINCGSTCSAAFASDSTVRLIAAPASGYRFAGWSGGGCSGTAACQVVLGTNTAVTAAFTVASNPECEKAKATVSEDQKKVGDATDALAKAKQAKHPSRSKLKKLKKKLKKAKARLAEDRKAQQQACA